MIVNSPVIALPPLVQDIQELCLSVDMELHDLLFVFV
jgi:hypothetical protein